MASIWQRIFRTPKVNNAVTPVIPSRSTTLATPESALTLTAVWRSVQILATTVSNLGLITKRYATGMEMVIDNPAFVNNPSLVMKRHEFIYSTATDLALYGNAFWYKSYDSAGRVNDVMQIPSWQVSIETETDALNSARRYVYLDKVYSAREIEHLQLFPRAGWLKGPSPIDTCSQDIVGALDLRNYQANWFSSGGVPTGVLKTGKEITPDDAQTITNAWNAKQATRQIAVLGNGFEYQQIALKPSEALFTEVSAQSVQQIARLFGIPPRKLVTGVDGTSDTYSNLVDEESAFYRETIQAYTRPIQDALSNCLPRGQRVEFMWEDLVLSKSDRLAMWADAIAAGIITPEYAAEKEGLNV
jgi:HK97 family phage portal protein